MLLPYFDRSLSTSERVSDLLSRMSLQEKIGQMMQLDSQTGIEDLISKFHVGSILHTSPDDMRKAAGLVEKTRLQIPLLVADDAIHGHSFWPGATIFPTQLAMASSWNRELVRDVARATASEVAATGLHWTFSPVLCIARDLRWGRVGETFGEDPHLIGELGAAMVTGYQGKGLSDKSAILACAKHFAGYSETQGGRDASEADLTPRKLRSWYLPPFEKVARAGCSTFMLGYQSIDGTPITANQWLLNDVLKGEWGFKGTLITDWDNVGRMVWEQKTAADLVEASAIAITAGNDIIMTTPGFFEGAQAAVEQGLISEEKIDEAVRRILTLKFELGLFEDPRLPDEELQKSVIASNEHLKLNDAIAQSSLVLLRNDGILPLDLRKHSRKKIAVIGPNADDQHAQLGDWAGASGQVRWLMQGHPRELTSTAWDGIREVFGESADLSYAQGCEIAHVDFPIDGLPQVTIADINEEMEGQALSVAAESDLIVAVVGDCVALAGEVRSTATLELMGGQKQLLEKLAALKKPMIVVVISTKPLALPESVLGANALIQAFSPGMAGGRAIAALIAGDTEPTGRLPISFARHAGQQPTFYNQVRGQHGSHYADLTQDPLFHFGEGLSYTNVEYSNLQIADSELTRNDILQVSVHLKNTGQRTARETVQLYIRDCVTSATWADRELKDFKQVNIAPGQELNVEFSLPISACTFVNAQGARVVEAGEFEVLIGKSSRLTDLQSGSFVVA